MAPKLWPPYEADRLVPPQTVATNRDDQLPAEYLAALAEQLDGADRIGAATDDREGERCIQMSDTVARLIAGRLREIARGTTEVLEILEIARNVVPTGCPGEIRLSHAVVVVMIETLQNIATDETD